MLVEGCSLTAYASSAPRCAATAGIVTLCACQAVMPNRSVLRAMRPDSPAVISISRSALCASGRASAASSDGMGVKSEQGWGLELDFLELQFSRDLEVRA